MKVGRKERFNWVKKLNTAQMKKALELNKKEGKRQAKQELTSKE